MIKNILKPLSQSLLSTRPSYSYISPIDKPVLSLALTSLHELSTELMLYPYLQMSICPEMSVFYGAIAFRLGMEAVAMLIRNFKFDNKNGLKTRDYVHERYKEDDRSSVKWIDRVFVLDTVRDLQFYGVEAHDINRAIWTYYRPGQLISSAFNIYISLNFFRGAHQLITLPHTVYLTSLAAHDPKFLTPLLIILVNFAWLKGSRHPFLIHLNHPGNFFTCFNFAFMSGLLFVPVPGVYHFAYLGLAVGHLLIRTTRHAGQDVVRNLKRLLK